MLLYKYNNGENNNYMAGKPKGAKLEKNWSPLKQKIMGQDYKRGRRDKVGVQDKGQTRQVQTDKTLMLAQLWHY